MANLKPKPYTSKAWLNHQRHGKNKSVETIAQECGVSENTIRNAMKRFNIR